MKPIILLFTITLIIVVPMFMANAALVPNCNSGCTYKDFIQLLVNFFNFLVFLSVPFAVLGISIGGLMMIIGSANTTAQSRGREILQDSIMGLLIVVSAWLIINT